MPFTVRKFVFSQNEQPNGLRYPLGVGGWIRPRNGIPPKPEKAQNAARTPSRICFVKGQLWQRAR